MGVSCDVTTDFVRQLHLTGYDGWVPQRSGEYMELPPDRSQGVIAAGSPQMKSAIRSQQGLAECAKVRRRPPSVTIYLFRFISCFDFMSDVFQSFLTIN